jgi:hypothetical protein
MFVGNTAHNFTVGILLTQCCGVNNSNLSRVEGRSQPRGALIKIVSSVQNSRTCTSILLKFDFGKFHEKVLSHFKFHFHWAVLTATLHNSINTFLEMYIRW